MRSLFIALVLLMGRESGYRQALPGYRYQFPRDHFEHPEFRTEWWYYTGNVRAENGSRYGFELVFFRQAQQRREQAGNSVWGVDDLYLAHLALSDIDRGQFVYRKRLSRAGPRLAGASFSRQRVWNGNWSAEWTGEKQVLHTVSEGIRFELTLQPQKPPVIHGENGVSQKAEGAGKASHYVSLPRLAVSGTLNGKSVQGVAWMDHEWFTHQLEASQSGWDWFSVQLENNSELMLFELRRKDGSIDPHSSGTFIDNAERTHHLKLEDISLQPLDWWTSPKTKARYPVKWRLQVPRFRIDLTCEAALRQQELVAEHESQPNYWEGAVTYTGTANGVGYLEMTGYDKPIIF